MKKYTDGDTGRSSDTNPRRRKPARFESGVWNQSVGYSELAERTCPAKGTRAKTGQNAGGVQV